MKKLFSFIATSAILLNSILAPVSALAQEATSTPAPTPEATIVPAETPVVTPEIIATPVETSTPLPEPTIAPEPTINTTVVVNEIIPVTVQESSIVKIITDKLDYSPSEIAVISGSGLEPNKTYSLTISSTDYPPTSTTIDITTNGSGEFSYNYQLDGKPRLNYSIEIKNGELTVAKASFTDTASVTTTLSNVSCMQDNPKSPKDLNCTANDVSIASVSGILVNGHGCRYPGDVVNFTADWQIVANASNRYNVGIYFATSGQTSALTGPTTSTGCSVTSLPSTPDPPFFDGGTSCGGITNDGTGSVSITMTAVCNPDSSGFLHLPYCTSWQENSQSSCAVPTDAVPGTKSKCNCKDGFTIPVTIPPSIELIKSLSPASDSGKFNLKINGTPYKTDAGNTGTTGKQTAIDGQNTISEAAGTGTSLANYTSSASCVLRGTTTDVAVTGTGPSWTLSASNGQDIVCTITNTVNNGSLTVIKHVVNSFGGTKVASNFTIGVTGGTPTSFSGSESGTSVTVPANEYYEVSETPVTGYSVGYSSDCSGTMPPGGSKTCTVTNTAIQPKLTVTKVVTNDNGGTKVVADFPLFVGATQVTSGVENGFNAGTYTVSETPQTGYTMTGITGDCAANGSITLSPGDVKSCTITNNDNAPALHLGKTVTTDNGGTALATAWTLTATGTILSPTNLSGTTPVDSGAGFKADTYALAESGGPSGYSAGTWDCGGATMPDATHVVVPLGGDVTCTINNNDIAPSLVLNKIVSNTSGGNAVITNWTLTASGPTSISGAGGISSGATFAAGTYTLSETGLSGYTPGSWICTGSGSQVGNQITIGVGQSAVCSITNSDVAPKITLNKLVNINYGGTATPSSFTLTIDGGGVVQGIATAVTSNIAHTINELSLAGYAFTSITGDALCPAVLGGSVTLTEGQNITCTITNHDLPATLIVIKHVVNDNGGGSTAGDFTMNVTGTDVSTASFNGQESPGTTITLDAGSYSVDETNFPGYAKTIGANCSGTIANGETKTCTITNNDIAPTLTLIKQVTNDNGGTATASAWTLSAIGDGGISGTGTVGPTAVKSNVAYTLSESGPAGYTAGAWNCVGGTMGVSAPTITLSEGESAVCTITNNDNAPSLKLIKSIDYGPKYPVDWNLSATATGSSFTDAGNSTTFHPVVANTGYTLSESTVEGYTQFGNWACNKGRLVGNILTLSLTDQETTCTIDNHRDMGRVLVHKNIDINGDGDWADTNETSDVYANANGFSWNFYNGQRSYGVLLTGIPTTTSYATYPISENMPADYRFVSWFNNNDEEASCTNPTGYSMPSTVQITKDTLTEITLCNVKEIPSISIAKSNNSGSGITAGSTVTYTLTITNTGNVTLSNIDITDYLPGGFSYVSGTTAGDITTDPAVSASGALTWNYAGPFTPQGVITFSYQAKTGSNLGNGTYTNFATCTANYGQILEVAAMLPELPNSTSCNTVSSNVVIGSTLSYSGTLIGQVLGASTELPATGSPTIILIVALGLISTGLILNAFIKKEGRKNAKK